MSEKHISSFNVVETDVDRCIRRIKLLRCNIYRFEQSSAANQSIF